MPDFPSLPFDEAIRDEILRCKVTDEPIDPNLPAGLTVEKLEEMRWRSEGGDNRVVFELKKLIREFPGVPALKNYLVVAHLARREDKKAREAERELLRSHPDYLFALVTEAERRLTQREFEKVPEILGSSLSLPTLYPDREVFHRSEWKFFYYMAGRYYIQTGNRLAAQAVIHALETHPDSKRQALELTNGLIMLGREQMRTILEKDRENGFQVKLAPIPRKSGKTPPARELNHDEIEELYSFDMDLPEESISALLALPRTTLIHDLEVLLQEAIEGGPGYYFKSKAGEPSCNYFGLHALYLLSELNAGEAVEKALEFLSAHEEIIHFWFGDMMTWEPVIGIIQARLPETAAWMKKPGLSTAARCRVSTAVAMIAVHSPEHRAEVLDWFRDVLTFYRDVPLDANVLDSELCALMVSDLVEIRAVELGDVIRDLYALQYVSIWIAGTFDDVMTDMSKVPTPSPSRKSMAEHYRSIAEEGAAEPEPAVAEGKGPGNFMPGGLFDDPTHEPPKKITIGRNDPCHCGSGLKYKKCCLNK